MTEREKQAVGVALGISMMQFPLRGGPPICEWNRQNLAKNGETEIRINMGERSGGIIRLSEPSTRNPGFLSYFM